ncbi:MAG: hypothetical protein HY910_06180 [Desulfarculus sp.]|nr:hypothetical protein [Desulfarculus sp.]
MTTRAYSPDMLLLLALERELRGLPPLEEYQLGAWAREVADYLRETGLAQSHGAGGVLATAGRALREMMCGGSWQFLLEDALNRPVVFARTLGIMLSFQAAPEQVALRQ